MKKFFLFALVAAFAFTSCTKDETIATTQPGAIAFAPAVDNATRSTDPSLTTTTIDNFQVYGFIKNTSGIGLVFNETGETVTKNSSNVWTYAHTQYWTRNEHYFAALAPFTAKQWELDRATDENLVKGIGEITFTNNGTQDLLYWAGKFDNAKGAYEQNPVHIAFNHLLSKVKFSFENAFDNNQVSLVVRDITITNAESNGTIDLAVENWWDGDDWILTEYKEGDAAFAVFGNAATAENRMTTTGGAVESDKEMLLFPVKNKSFNITFKVDIYMGDLLAQTIAHDVNVETTLEMGKAYNFKAILSGESEQLNPIEFEVEVLDWDQAGEVSVITKYSNVDVAAGESLTLTADGTIVGTMKVAGTLDGNGHTLFAEATPANNGMIRPTGTATVKNVNIDGKGVRTTDDKSIRGIYITTNGTYVIENVKILNCGYAFNAQTSAQSSLKVSKSTFEGWSSYDLDGTVNVTDVLAEFTDVNFTRGTYAKLVDDQGNLLKNGWLRPYNSTILTNCTFEEGYTIDLGQLVAGGTVKFVNCTYGTTVITADNIATLGFVENYDANKVVF